MNIDPNTKTVAVHGREALDLPYTRWSNAEPPVQIDISASTMFIEIPGANIRKALVPNPADPKGLRIFLTREEVAFIPTRPTPYVLIDETNDDSPFIEMEAKIYRTGYTQEPVAQPPLP